MNEARQKTFCRPTSNYGPGRRDSASAWHLTPSAVGTAGCGHHLALLGRHAVEGSGSFPSAEISTRVTPNHVLPLPTHYHSEHRTSVTRASRQNSRIANFGSRGSFMGSATRKWKFAIPRAAQPADMPNNGFRPCNYTFEPSNPHAGVTRCDKAEGASVDQRVPVGTAWAQHQVRRPTWSRGKANKWLAVFRKQCNSQRTSGAHHRQIERADGSIRKVVQESGDQLCITKLTLISHLQ